MSSNSVKEIFKESIDKLNSILMYLDHQLGTVSLTKEEIESLGGVKNTVEPLHTILEEPKGKKNEKTKEKIKEEKKEEKKKSIKRNIKKRKRMSIKKKKKKNIKKGIKIKKIKKKKRKKQKEKEKKKKRKNMNKKKQWNQKKYLNYVICVSVMSKNVQY